jgi:hypothetical protein
MREDFSLDNSLAQQGKTVLQHPRVPTASPISTKTGTSLGSCPEEHEDNEFEE